MACLAARNKAYHERGITSPEMIVPDTGHAAFYKAGEYFKIKVHRVRCPAPTYKADIGAISWLINPNTILLVGSAPNYPHGIIDDIPALSRLAVKKKIPLHVDCCLGSFVIACLEKAGFESEMFDFRLKGVTSISCDTHKYGFAPKGSSTVLYRSKDMRAYQYFIYADWPGGIYGSPSMAGSRPGALIAGCWATMMRVGEAGYVDATHKIVTAARKIEVAIREDPELSADLDVMGQPKVTVVAFMPSPSSELNIYRLADEMKERGWHLNALQDPPGLHVAVTIPIVSSADDLLSDLKETLRKMREDDAKDQAEGKLENKKKKMGDTAVVYGVAGSFPDKGIVKELTKGFLDTMYKA
jgi:sphinganine-1-phosphate aldolase